MFINATPKRATVYHASGDETLLVIECIAASNSSVLEIGKQHVFASRKKRSLLSRRHACDLHVRIKRRSSIGEKSVEKLNLSKDKIGELTFCPPSKADDVNTATPASLDATVFLEDPVFDSLMNALQFGKRPEWLQLDLQREGSIRYGWEPDGSRMEWKIENTTDSTSVEVTKIAMGLQLFN